MPGGIILNRFGVANDALPRHGRHQATHSVHAEHGAIVIGLARTIPTPCSIMGSGHQPQPRVGVRRASAPATARSSHGVVLPLSLPGVADSPTRVLDRDQRVRDPPSWAGRRPGWRPPRSATSSSEPLDWSLGAALAVVLIVSTLLLFVRRIAAQAPKKRRCEFQEVARQATPWADLRLAVIPDLRILARPSSSLLRCRSTQRTRSAFPPRRFSLPLGGARANRRVARSLWFSIELGSLAALVATRSPPWPSLHLTASAAASIPWR